MAFGRHVVIREIVAIEFKESDINRGRGHGEVVTARQCV
jgi:hypothetical protein